MKQMLSKFNAFGEVQSHMLERLDRMDPDLHAVKEDVAVLKAAARSHTDAIRANTEAIHALRADVTTLKSHVAEIKSDVKGYNQRLEVVEAKLSS